MQRSFLESKLPEVPESESCCRRESFGTIEAGVASLTRIPLDALQVKAALPPNVLTINQYSIPPILLHIV